MIESLFRRLHEVYMVEAKRQGDVRHKESYDELAENIKDFDRGMKSRDTWKVKKNEY